MGQLIILMGATLIFHADGGCDVATADDSIGHHLWLTVAMVVSLVA